MPHDKPFYDRVIEMYQRMEAASKELGFYLISDRVILVDRETGRTTTAAWFPKAD